MEKILELLSLPKDGSLPEIAIEFSSDIDRNSMLKLILESSDISTDSSIQIDEKSIPGNKSGSKKLLGRLKTGHHISLQNFKNLPQLGLGIFDN